METYSRRNPNCRQVTPLRAIEVEEKYLRRVGIAYEQIYDFAMHIACEIHTRDWDEESWTSIDPLDFKAQYFEEKSRV